VNETRPIVIVGNGPYANRGCEAIAKSSIRIIRDHLPGVSIINGNPFAEYDQADETEPDVRHEQCVPCRGPYSRMWMSHRLFKATGIARNFSSAGRWVQSRSHGAAAVLSAGGDLYGLSYGEEQLLQYLFFGLAALGAKTPFVIWGATIGKMDASPKLKKLAMEHFKRCSLVLVREQDSVDYLASCGVKDNVRLVADPAFVLEPGKPAFDLRLNDPLGESIGFNLAAAYGAYGGNGSFKDMVALGADCVEEIVRRTKRPVILVPHVVGYPPGACPDNDTVFLSLIREVLAQRGVDVGMASSSLRSWELKWVLGHLKTYVGSRWHSTVGALGSATPTLSIGFSEKAPALNKFLLGHDRYVLNCKELNPVGLADKLEELLTNEEQVRQALRDRLPAVQELARSAGAHLKELLAG